MMKGDGAEGGALGAKTARACDSCLRRRARWFCGADDAFLCHSCDTLVHSANQLASRHERVRLQTASAKVTTTWHSGFTRKARTPRRTHNKHLNLQQQRLKDRVLFNNNNTILPLVPELEEQEPLLDYDLLCRVPVFNVVDIYNNEEEEEERLELDNNTVKNIIDEEGCDDLDTFSEFGVDLADFTANVESLLGVGTSSHEVHHQVFDYNQDHVRVGEKGNSSMVVKVKDELDDLGSVFDVTSDEIFHWNIDDSHAKEKVVAVSSNNIKDEAKRERFLRLNYEEVISAWTSSQGSNSSPWTTGNPPNDNFTIDDDSWSNYLEGANEEVRRQLLLKGGDGGREARVSRYREKRRTRLFAKKIRYEVRKLNAEKRPRMKGRFVKRTSFVGGSFSN